MEHARLNELMPGFDKKKEWNTLAGRLGHKPRTRAFTWKRAAAVAMLVGAVSITAVLFKNSGTGSTVALADTTHDGNWRAEVVPDVPAMHTYAAAEEKTAAATAKAPATTNEINKTAPVRNKMPGSAGYKRTEEFVCNGTPCPLEICIIQTIRCKDKAPSAIATCNTLEPDQARQLHYRAPEAVGAQCKVTVDEIRIRRVTTGETIVLNAHSQPSTAQELFNCITGKEKCNLLAGIFESDCNDERRSHGLKIDNTMGPLIME